MQQNFPSHDDAFVRDSSHYDGGKIGDNLTWVFDNGTLTISGTGEMRDFDDPYLVPWHSYSALIQQVVINEGVTSIGNNAFYDARNVAQNNGTFQAPADLTDIGEHAFYDADNPVTEFNARLDVKINPSVRFDNANVQISDLVETGQYGTEEASSIDYTVRYSTDEGKTWISGYPKNVGQYLVEVTLNEKRSTQNSVEVTFHQAQGIVALEITKASINITAITPDTGRYYDGTTDVHISEVSANPSHSGSFPRLNTDYEVEAEYVSSNAGTNVVRITKFTVKNEALMANYDYTWDDGLLKVPTSILRKKLDASMFASIPQQAYIEGAAATPMPQIAASESSPMTTNDFTVTYRDNVNEGTGYAIVTGKNNYQGTIEIPFNISSSVPSTPRLTAYTNNSYTSPAVNFEYGSTMHFNLVGLSENNGDTVRLTATPIDASQEATSITLGEAGVVSNGTVSFSYDTVAKILPIGTYTVTAVNQNNEQIATSTVTLDQKVLSVTPDENNIMVAKGYDGTNKVLTEEEGATRYLMKFNFSGQLPSDTDLSVGFDAAYASSSINEDTIHVSNLHFESESGAGAFYKPDTNYFILTADTDSSMLIGIYKVGLTPTVTFETKEYDGTEDPIIANVEWDGLLEGDTLENGVDYTVIASYDSADAGTNKTINYTVKINNTEATRNYTLSEQGAQNLIVTNQIIEPLELSQNMFNTIGEQQYTGKAIEPNIADYIDYTYLTANDLIVTYDENISGTGTIHVTGARNFKGTLDLSFNIVGGPTDPDPDPEPGPGPEPAKPELQNVALYNGASTVSDTTFTYGDTITVKGTLANVEEPTEVQLQDANGPFWLLGIQLKAVHSPSNTTPPTGN